MGKALRVFLVIALLGAFTAFGGTASGWIYDKFIPAEIPVVNVNSDDPIEEVILERFSQDPVTAILTDSLRLCLASDVTVLLVCDQTPVGIHISSTVEQVDGFLGDDLIVEFSPSDDGMNPGGAVWGDVFGTAPVIVEICITGLVNIGPGDVLGIGVETLHNDTPPFGLCELLQLVDDPLVTDQRMTGGGSVFFDDARITRGLEIRCDADDPRQNLQVNWHGGTDGGLKFHLLDLTSAICSDEPVYEEFPPEAGFDTFVGEGLGRVKNGGGWVEGWFIKFRFEDHGEPGDEDVAEIEIWAPGADPDVDDPDAAAIGIITKGNLQAHLN